jgi:lysophospholipase L1-like esterase
VRWANRRGQYLVVDWHSIGNLNRGLFQHPMYDTSLIETTRFWRAIAHRYRGVPTMAIYELFNEPTDNYIGAGAGSLGKASWDEWRVTMEDLIDLVRVYDPGAVPLVAGFNWAYDLSDVSDKPIRRDGVAYAVHAYPQKAKPDTPDKAALFALWEQQWGHLAERYPLFASEIGWVREDGYNAHIPVIDNSGSYGPMLVEFMEARGISWTVWNFDPEWSPTMISDWDFTATEQGRFFRYVMQRLRAGALPPAALPAPRLTEYPWMSIERWRTMWAEDLAVAGAGEVELLLLGDSISEGWPESIWQERFPDTSVANFGIGGDRTENLLWRLQNGAADGLQPEVVVLMIGVNNFLQRDDSPQDVFTGVKAVIEETKARFAGAQLVLLGILPYGEQPGTAERARVAEANALLAVLGEDERVDYHDIGPAFLQPDGSIAPEIMPDALHPSERGYQIFADQLQPIVAPLLD